MAAVAGPGDAATIDDNFTELHALLNELRATLVLFGTMKGGGRGQS